MAFRLPPRGQRVAIHRGSLTVTTGPFRTSWALPLARPSPIPGIPTTTSRPSASLSPLGLTRTLGLLIAIQLPQTPNQTADRGSWLHLRNASTSAVALVVTS